MHVYNTAVSRYDGIVPYGFMAFSQFQSCTPGFFPRQCEFHPFYLAHHRIVADRCLIAWVANDRAVTVQCD